MKHLDLRRVVLVQLKQSRIARALEIMSKGWPWNREIYAIILEAPRRRWRKRLSLSIASFPSPRRATMPFVSHLERFRPQAVIGSNFVSRENVNRSSRIPSSYEPADRNADPKDPDAR